MVDAQSKLRDVTRMFADFQHRKKKSCAINRTIDNTKTEDAYESDRGQVPVGSTPKTKKRKSTYSWSSNTGSSKRKISKDKGSTGKENKLVKSKRKNRSVSLKPLITRSTYMSVTKSEDVTTPEANSPIPKVKRRFSLRHHTRVSEFTKTDATKTEETAYEPEPTGAMGEKENLPPQNKYGKDCIEQRECDAMENENFEVVQNARPATTQFRAKELRWKDTEEIFDDEHESERLSLSLKVLSIMNNNKLLDDSLKSEEKETLRSYFTSISSDKPSIEIMELLDRSIGSALRQMRRHPERFRGEVDDHMMRFIRSSRRVKPILVEVMMMFPENMPESWGGNCYNKNVTAKLAENKRDRRTVSPASAVPVPGKRTNRRERESFQSEEKIVKPEVQVKQKNAQLKGPSAEESHLQKSGNTHAAETKMPQKEPGKAEGALPKVKIMKQVQQAKPVEVKGTGSGSTEDGTDIGQKGLTKVPDDTSMRAGGRKEMQKKKAILEGFTPVIDITVEENMGNDENKNAQSREGTQKRSTPEFCGESIDEDNDEKRTISERNATVSEKQIATSSEKRSDEDQLSPECR